jgi:hypothetical protein
VGDLADSTVWTGVAGAEPATVSATMGAEAGGLVEGTLVGSERPDCEPGLAIAAIPTMAIAAAIGHA